MTITKTNIGTDDQGNPRYHYASDGHVVLTGPATGAVTLADGTEYDVTEAVIEVASVEHAVETAHLIGGI